MIRILLTFYYKEWTRIPLKLAFNCGIMWSCSFKFGSSLQFGIHKEGKVSFLIILEIISIIFINFFLIFNSLDGHSLKILSF